LISTNSSPGTYNLKPQYIDNKAFFKDIIKTYVPGTNPNVSDDLTFIATQYKLIIKARVTPKPDCRKEAWQQMTTEDRKVVSLKLGESKTITVPKYFKRQETISKDCPGEAEITLTDAPEFFKLSKLDNELDEAKRPIQKLTIAPTNLEHIGDYKVWVT
jgi:hypothetical protein